MLSSAASRATAVLGLLVAGVWCAPRSRQEPIAEVTNFYTFGDSYTDSCNSYRLLYKNVSHPLFPACNPPPIGRAVGGPEWPEYIVSDQQQANKPVAKRASSEPWKVVNFAYSGATCDNVNFPRPVLDVGQQIGTFSTGLENWPPHPTLGSDPAKTVAVVFIGGNDVITMILPFVQPIYVFPGATVENETRCIRKRLQTLHQQGFRRIVLVSNTPVQYAPDVVSMGGKATELAQKYSEANNEQQAAVVKDLVEQFNAHVPAGKLKTTIDIFPAYDLFDRVHRSGAEYGFTDTTTPCKGLPSCDGYFWYDGLHPYTRFWHIFARKMTRFVKTGARGSELIEGDEGVAGP